MCSSDLVQNGVWSWAVDVGAAAPDGGGASRRRPRSPMLRRFYEAEPLSSEGLGGDLDEDCLGRGFVDPTGSSSGNAKVDLVATLGWRPRNRWILVATWMKTARAEGSSTMTGSPSDNAKVDLVGTPGRRPRVGGVCCGVLVDWCRVGGKSPRLCGFFLPCFPHKQGIVQFVWFLGPVFLINWVNSILSIRAVDIDHVKLKNSNVRANLLN